MLKHIFALAMTIVVYQGLYACDACSCTSMNSLDGQLLPSNKSFLGISSSFVHQLNASEQRINNASYSLFAAYSFAKKWQVLLNLPFQQNVIIADQGPQSGQFGLGDFSGILSYQAFTTAAENKQRSTSTLLLRTGLKLPTGYYNHDKVMTSNLGTKSWDVLFAAQYIFERESKGLNLAINGRLNTVNPYKYKYGNKYDFSAFYYVKGERAQKAYMPFVGLGGEWIQLDRSNGFLRKLSGGKALYGMGGFLLNWKETISIFAKGELPVVQDYLSQDGKVYTNIRAQVQLTYFPKKKAKPAKTLNL